MVLGQPPELLFQPWVKMTVGQALLPGVGEEGGGHRRAGEIGLGVGGEKAEEQAEEQRQEG